MARFCPADDLHRPPAGKHLPLRHPGDFRPFRRCRAVRIPVRRIGGARLRIVKARDADEAVKKGALANAVIQISHGVGLYFSGDRCSYYNPDLFSCRQRSRAFCTSASKSVAISRGRVHLGDASRIAYVTSQNCLPRFFEVQSSWSFRDCSPRRLHAAAYEAS